MDERMKEAYEAARLLLRAKDHGGLRRAPGGPAGPADGSGDAANRGRDRILCVRGCYDRAETVLEILDVGYDMVDGPELARRPLQPDQLLIINCPGSDIPEPALERIGSFVRGGGTLVTTDWALRHVVEPAFPGYLQYNGRATFGGLNESVRIRLAAPENPVVRGITGTGEDPVWWLESSSYPVRILAPGRVEVLIDSEEMAERYGDGAIMVRFPYGRGMVYHMVSHYFLQRAETRSKRSDGSAASILSEAGFGAEVAEQYGNLNVGEVESAYSSLCMMQSLLNESVGREAVDEEGAAGRARGTA